MRGFLVLVVPMLLLAQNPRAVTRFVGHGAPGSLPTSILGDKYIDSDAGKEYTCFSASGGCRSVAVGGWVLGGVGATCGTPNCSVAGDLTVSGTSGIVASPWLISPTGGFGTFQNFLHYSDAYDTGAWTLSNVVIGNAKLAGPNNDFIYENDPTSTSSGGYLSQIYDTGNALTDRAFTFSCWIKAPSGTVTSRYTIRSTTPTVAASQTITATSQWQRLYVSGIFPTDAGTSIEVRILPTDSGTGTIYIWGTQLEEVTNQPTNQPSVYTSTMSSPVVSRLVGLTVSHGDSGSGASILLAGAGANNSGLTANGVQVGIGYGTSVDARFTQTYGGLDNFSSGALANDLTGTMCFGISHAGGAASTGACSILITTGAPGPVVIGNSITVTSLAGSGNAFACLDAAGKLYRSATACAP